MIIQTTIHIYEKGSGEMREQTTTTWFLFIPVYRRTIKVFK